MVFLTPRNLDIVLLAPFSNFTVQPKTSTSTFITMIVLTPHNIDIGKDNLDLDRFDSFDPPQNLDIG